MLVDLTQTLSPETPVFPGYPSPIIHRWTSIGEEGYYSNMLFLVEHTGTHMDSPAHFVEGAPTIDKLPLDKFFARAVALDFTWKKGGDVVTADEVREALGRLGVEPGPGWYVLFAFGWDRVRGGEWVNYPYLEDEVASMLAEMGVEGIGMDTPSPDREPFRVHKILLPRGIVIVENMASLPEVVGRAFDLTVLPIKIGGGSAAPVRCVARL